MKHIILMLLVGCGPLTPEVKTDNSVSGKTEHEATVTGDATIKTESILDKALIICEIERPDGSLRPMRLWTDTQRDCFALFTKAGVLQ